MNLPTIRDNIEMTDRKKLEDLVEKYFSLGLCHTEILLYLNTLHDITISLRTLKRILSKLNLYRKKNYSSVEHVAEFIQSEINKSGQLNGYRWMHLKCLQHGLVTTQQIVRELLKLLDPIGVEIRRRKRLRRRQYTNKGPNFMWHMDAYDKLKPYGICISGCIDGFSRYIIWLRAARTSSDPKVILGYFLDAIKALNGFPQTIRADLGTENGRVEKCQKALYTCFNQSNRHSLPSFLYGKSTANQRIESWWAILRKETSQYWINVFETLKDEGAFNGSFLDKSLIQFCFLNVIQSELDEVVLQWNIHKMQKSRNSRAPNGRPAIMFEMPNLYETTSYLSEIPSMCLDIIESECTRIQLPCDEDVYNMCNYIVAENSYRTSSTDPYVALQLYLNLRSKLYTLLETN